MDLKNFFFDFRYIDCCKKMLFFSGIFLYSLNTAYGQCSIADATAAHIPVYTVNGVVYNASTCDVQNITFSNTPFGHLDPTGLIIRMNFLALVNAGNVYRFSTVGGTADDTELTLYDSSGNLITYNDDDAVYATPQSTIVLTIGATNYTSPYLIISRKGCQPLTRPLTIKISVKNASDGGPDISESIFFYPCVGQSIKLTSTIPAGITITGNTWGTSNPAVATIDSNGLITFTGAGTVEISLKNPGAASPTCVALKTYVVKKPTTTSAINHD